MEQNRNKKKNIVNELAEFIINEGEYEKFLNKTYHIEKFNKYFYGWSPLGFLYYGKLAQNEIAWHVATNQIPEEYEVEVAKYFLPEV